MMDITILEGLIARVGLPVAICSVFIWMVIDWYRFTKTKVAEHLETQTQILAKQTVTVESIAKAVEIFANLLQQICNNITIMDGKIDAQTLRTVAEIARVQTRETQQDAPPKT